MIEWEIEFINPTKPNRSSVLDDLESMTFGGGVKQQKEKEEKKKEKKKSKKEKKAEKKKSKKRDTLDIDFTPIAGSDDPNAVNLDLDEDLASMIDEMFDEEGNPIIDPIIDAEKNSYKKRKNDKNNPYKKEFAEEMTLLYDLYDSVSTFAKEIEKGLKATTGSKVRGGTKNYADMVANFLSAKGTQLQVIKELNATKKAMADLKLKEDARNAKSEGAGDSNGVLLASTYLNQLMSAGRKNVTQSLRGTSKPGFLIDSYASDGDYDETGTLLDYAGTTPGFSDNEDFQMNQFLLERIDEEEGFSNLRTSDGNKLIQYENRGVQVCIKKDISTGEYEFIALDRDDQIIYDYPLPQNPGKIRFAGHSASDRHGNSYRVIEYDSAAFADDEYEDDYEE